MIWIRLQLAEILPCYLPRSPFNNASPKHLESLQYNQGHEMDTTEKLTLPDSTALPISDDVTPECS